MEATGANMGGQFGDTTFTKLFVGGLAWETQRDTLNTYFEQFGEILEAVVITDKSSGRSKGYGFVTFRDPEAALRACEDPTPVIDGRRANCNLAYLGISKSKSTSPKHGKSNLRGTKASQSAGIHGGIGMGSFPSPATFPQYAVQQGVPYNVYGYSPYSPDYAYPMNYYGLYGGGGAQYTMYGGGAAGVMPGHSSNGYYPVFHYDPAACGGGLAYAQGCQGLGVAVPRSTAIPYGGVTGLTPQIYGGPPITYATLTTPASQGMTVALMTAPTQMISLVPRSYRIIPTHVLPPTAASEKPLA